MSFDDLSGLTKSETRCSSNRSSGPPSAEPQSEECVHSEASQRRRAPRRTSLRRETASATRWTRGSAGTLLLGVLLLVASSGAAEHPVEVALSIERSSLLREFRYGAQLCDGASHPKGSTLGSVPQSGKGAGGASPPEKR